MINRRRLLSRIKDYSALVVAGAAGTIMSGKVFGKSQAQQAQSAAASGATTDTSKPNIIVIMGDDHARWAVGTYGFKQNLTPNMDWLARNGVKFNQAISPAPVCSPARASFYTGKMPSQHGVHDFLAEGGAAKTNWLAGETLLSERLKQQGYRTALIGKWHATADARKPQAGFDRWLSYDVYREGWQNQYLHRGEVYFSDDGDQSSYKGVQARYLTEEAIKFIDQPSQSPFFISLNFVEPHAPFDAMPERLVQKYRGMAYDLLSDGGFSDLEDRGARTSTPTDHDEKLAQYLAAAALIDEQIGRVIDALEGRGILGNTIIVYTSDHGLLMGKYGLYGKVNATKPANFYEDTISIPLIVYGGANYIRQAQQRDEFVTLLDLHTTVMDFATPGGIKASNYGPGVSLRPLLAGKRLTDWRAFHFAERANARMVSNGHWKLVRYYKKAKESAPDDYWYDLSNPLGEQRQALAAPDESTRNALIAALETYFTQYEVAEKSGRTIWNQPAPNPRLAEDLKAFQ